MKNYRIIIFIIMISLIIFMIGCVCDKNKYYKSNSNSIKYNHSSNKLDDRVCIGMTVQDLTNPTWTGIKTTVEKAAEEYGYKINCLSCNNDVLRQIEQIEDFIHDEIDMIIVQPVDPKSIEDICERAMKKGIKVISWDDAIENCDVAFTVDNYVLGEEIGHQAANFIKENHNYNCEVAILNYPQLPILLERENGIVDELKKEVPNVNIVAQQSAINPSEGKMKMENIFKTNPNVKVVCCIGGGGAVGANEVAMDKFSSKIPKDFGIFSADCTPEELAAIRRNEGNRMSVLITGGPKAIGDAVVSIAKKLLDGNNINKIHYRELIPVNADNIDKVDTE